MWNLMITSEMATCQYGEQIMLGESWEKRYIVISSLFLKLFVFVNKVDKTDWKRHGRPTVVNAFYSSIENSMQFPAGILQVHISLMKQIKHKIIREISLDPADFHILTMVPLVGWLDMKSHMDLMTRQEIVTHEKKKKSDKFWGRQYDSEGNLGNWWEDMTRDKFLKKANCIIWQYGNYTAKAVNKNLNGINTQVGINLVFIMWDMIHIGWEHCR